MKALIEPHLEHLKEVFDLPRRQVVDVGAGAGAFARSLANEGAYVTAVDPNPPVVEHIDRVTWHAGIAEALPLADASVDLVCFMFSLHHVPLLHHPQALNEAIRVLKSQGRLHIVEPLTRGSMTDVLKFVEDETHVRLETAKNISQFARNGSVSAISEQTYEVTRQFRNFEGFVERVTNTNPERKAKLPVVRSQMEQTFIQKAEAKNGFLILRQPCRSMHFSVR